MAEAHAVEIDESTPIRQLLHFSDTFPLPR